MAKKAITPNDFQEKLNKKAEKRASFTKAFLDSCALFLGCAVMFSSTVIAYSRVGSAQKSVVAQSDNVVLKEDENTIDWDAPKNDPDENEKTDPEATDKNDDSSGEDNSVTTEKPKKELSTAREQYDYFIRSFENVKKNAKSVELYWRHDSNYKNIVDVPAGLSSLADALMEKNLKSGDVAGEKYTGEDIKANFPPEGVESCNLKTSDIKEIKLTEDEKYYEITIVCKNSVNAVAGEGAGSIASVLTTNQIYDPIANIPVVKNIGEPTCNYEAVTCVAKIEKSTGNLVHYYTNVPLILSFEKVKVRVGLQFEEKWKIQY